MESSKSQWMTWNVTLNLKSLFTAKARETGKGMRTEKEGMLLTNKT